MIGLKMEASIFINILSFKMSIIEVNYFLLHIFSKIGAGKPQILNEDKEIILPSH